MKRRSSHAIQVLFWAAAVASGSARLSGQALDGIREWSLTSVVGIGSANDPRYGLSVVRDVLADSDRVYVLLSQDGVVRAFTRDGDFVRDFGGRGQGPGEFVSPSSMGWYESRLWVADFRTLRFTLIDVETGAAETIPYRVDVPDTYYIDRIAPRAVLADGRLAGSEVLSVVGLTRGGITETPVVVSDADIATLDTLALRSVAGQTAEITAGLPRDTWDFVTHPLPDDDMISFAPDGSGAVLVRRKSWLGRGPAEFEVAKIDVRGDTLFHRRFAYEPRQIPSGFFENEIDGAAGGGGIVDRRAFAGALREFYERRQYFPPVTHLTAGSDGTTWLAGPNDEGQRWWFVLDASGAGIGRVRLPASSVVESANQAEIWVVEKDALDIPYVVRYDIVP